MSVRLHLRPVPTANILTFPCTAANSPDVVMAQMENIYLAMEAIHGTYLARNFFVEAAATVAARCAHPHGPVAIAEAREDLTVCFDQALVELQPPAPKAQHHPSILNVLLAFGAASWFLAAVGLVHLA